MLKNSLGLESNKTLPFEYKGRLRPDEFLLKCDEAIRLELGRLHIKTRVFVIPLALLFIKYHPEPMTIRRIYDLLLINYDNRNFDDFENERYKIKKAVKIMVARGLIFAQSRNYLCYFDILKLDSDEQHLEKFFDKSNQMLESTCQTLRETPTNNYDFYNEINSKSKICISREGNEYIKHQIEKVLDIIIEESEENIVTETYESLKKGSNETPKEIPFYIIHKVVNRHIIL